MLIPVALSAWMTRFTTSHVLDKARLLGIFSMSWDILENCRLGTSVPHVTRLSSRIYTASGIANSPCKRVQRTTDYLMAWRGTHNVMMVAFFFVPITDSLEITPVLRHDHLSPFAAGNSNPERSIERIKLTRSTSEALNVNKEKQ